MLKKRHVTYQILLSSLAIVSIYFCIADITKQIDMKGNKFIAWFDIIIWAIFTFDYCYKFCKSEDKKHYVQNNWLDSLAIIPVPIISIFINNQFVSWLRVFRVLAFLDEIWDGFKIFLKFRGVGTAIFILTIVVMGSSLGIYFVERGTTVNSIGDAFWWSIVTTTTVGYGDISPKTGIGRMIAVTLMMTGVCVFGIVMSSAAEILTKKKKHEGVPELADLSGLSSNDKKLVNDYIDFLKNREEE